MSTDMQAAEETAVMQVIEAESRAFWLKDFDAWADCWLHSPAIRMMGWWAAGGIRVTEGWEALSAGMRQVMDASPEPNPTASQVRRERINLRVRESMAWVTFDQYGADTGDSSMDMPGLSRETRILEKHDGQWKIVYVGWLLEGEGSSPE
ncbi:MAG: nuclear transport factor 2 family protein [Chloroflexi bacterium]|nr:nuclear transport factor 2 family protein [Chloroflexota bacterium]